jgi:hypothetical protein
LNNINISKKVLIFGLILILLPSAIIKSDENQIPEVKIVYPEDGDILSDEIIITGIAQDLDGTIQKVDVKIDTNIEEQADGTNDWSYLWNTSNISDGIHTISVRSYDGKDYSNIKRITVIVNNKDDNKSWQDDTEKPIEILTITNPSNNDILSGIINISGTTKDIRGNFNIQISSGELVRLYIKEDNTWNYIWDTTNISDGLYNITIGFYSWSGESTIKTIQVIVNNAAQYINQITTVSIINPANDASLKGIITINGTAFDIESNIQFIEIKLNDGSWEQAEGTNLWNFIWNTTNLENGEYIIYARSYDGENYSNTESVNVFVENNSTPGFELLFFIISLIYLSYIFYTKKR